MASIGDIWGLETALDSKAQKHHHHRVDQVEGLRDLLLMLQQSISSQVPQTLGPISIATVEGLASALDGKAPAVHVHTIASVQGLTAALDAIAATAHSDLISAVLSLQGIVEGKAAAAHAHATATGQQAGFMSAADKLKLDGLGGSTQPTIADVQGLQGALDAKAPLNHSQAIASVTGLQGALDSKAASDHTHSGLPSLNPQPIPYTFSQSTVYQSNSNYQGSYNSLNDGSYTTGAGTGSGSFEWLKADLGSVKAIARVGVGSGNPSGWGSTASYLNASVLEVSIDGSTWSLLLPTLSQIADNATTLFAFGAVACQYVRLRKSGFIGCTELKIYG